MIPKKIHYCWFGRGEKPKLAQKCIASWKKYCPDFEIIEWNEDNFDVNLNGYTQMCYEQKKYAFLSDYVRLKVLLEHGGVYFDTDVEVVRSFEKLLAHPAFFGFEDDAHVNTGVGFGCEAGNSVIKTMLEEYDPLLDGEHGVIGCPILNTQALVKHGLVLNGSSQKLSDAAVYCAEWFNPYDDPTGRLNKTSNTHSIHWYAKSWLSKGTILRSKLTKPLHRIFGTDCFKRRRNKQ
jgi:hypothetical protein